MSAAEKRFLFSMSIAEEVVVLIGILGHIGSFIVYTRSTFKKNSVSVYCRALAISEMFIAFQAVFDLFFLLNGYYITNYSDTTCKLFIYALYAFGSITGWILIAFSIDRVLSLKKVTNTMKRPLIHYAIVIAIVVAHLLLYIEIPIFLKLVYYEYPGVKFSVCDPSLLPFANVLNIIYIIDGSILPFVVMTVTSLITIKLLRDSRNHVVNLTTADNKRKNRDTKFAITSLAFNFLFIALKMPLAIATTIGYVNISLYFLSAATLLYFIYYSSSFFVHLVSNTLFRRELFILLRIQKPLSGSMLHTNQLNRQSTIRHKDEGSNFESKKP